MKSTKQIWKNNYNKKEKKNKTLWIIIIIYNAIGVGWIVVSLHPLIFITL